jgi:GR25 family glycosyltransferase involved in LPS biosynthesis
MSSFEALIQNHFYINLDERNDRMVHCEEELKKIGLDRPSRFSAIKTKVGIVGCGLSHLRCIESAKKEGLPYITIFEDDIVISKPNQLKNIVNRILQSGVDWDVLCLGGNAFKPHKEEHDDFVVVNRMYCGTGYIVKAHFYDTMIDNIRQGLAKLMETGDRQYSWDAWWINLQRQHRFLLINPLSVYQREDYSDIENKTVNYKELMLNIDK